MAEIEIRMPGQARRTVPVGAGELLVGRWEGCEVPVPEEVKQVSKRHLVIVSGADGVRVRDLDSKNGTTLNGGPLRGETRWGEGDLLVLGGVVELRLLGAPEVPAPRSDGLDAARRAVARLRDLEPDLAQRLESWAQARSVEVEAQGWAREQLVRLRWARSEREQLQGVVDAVVALTGASVWALAWDGAADGGRIRYRHLVPGGEARDVPAPRALSASVVGLSMRRGRPLWTDDATTDPRLRGAASVMDLQLRSVGCVPLGRQAVLYLNAGQRPFDEGTRVRIEALCGWVGALLQPPPPQGTQTLMGTALPGWIGASRVMQELAGELSTWAPLPFNVLLLGERGTGKSQAARVLHQLSGSAARFVHVDCPSHVRGDTAASALFGHEKGAFTGADARHVGFLEEVGQGTLFLDEIGELSPDVQTLLLNVLQERRFRRVGGDRDLAFEGRVVAATNRPIDEVGSTFRRDLYDRLAEVEVRLPPLRERREDVPLLALHFLEVESDRIRRPGLVLPHGVSREAAAVLAGGELAGNVRDVQNAVRRALGAALREGAAELLPHHFGARAADAADAEPVEPVETGPYWEQVFAFERRLLARALDEADGNQRKAAERLGLTNQAWHRARKRVGFEV